uniref:Noc-4 n=1 Tax=Nocardia sp. ATCC 202099 TaxID=930400 RepID=E5DUF7_9NOCA|nr:Noc-4 [Nocardia sp. ATCC 202099]
MTITWSPASCSAWMTQEIQARASSSSGPVGAGVQGVPAKRSTPRAAKRRQIRSPARSRTLTVNVPLRRMVGQVDDDLAAHTSTRGGSRDTDVIELQAKPTGRPRASVEVTMVTPVGR